jgi:hypothetical protein
MWILYFFTQLFVARRIQLYLRLVNDLSVSDIFRISWLWRTPRNKKSTKSWSKKYSNVPRSLAVL